MDIVDAELVQQAFSETEDESDDYTFSRFWEKQWDTVLFTLAISVIGYLCARILEFLGKKWSNRKERVELVKSLVKEIMGMQPLFEQSIKGVTAPLHASVYDSALHDGSIRLLEKENLFKI